MHGESESEVRMAVAPAVNENQLYHHRHRVCIPYRTHRLWTIVEIVLDTTIARAWTGATGKINGDSESVLRSIGSHVVGEL